MKIKRIKIIFLIGLIACVVTKNYCAENVDYSFYPDFADTCDEDENQKIKKSIHEASHQLLMWAAKNVKTLYEVKSLFSIIKNLNPDLHLDFIPDYTRDDNCDQDNKTVLMYAAQHSNGAMVQLLLAARANPNQANDNGETALGYAVEYTCSNTDIVRALLDAGARKNDSDRSGKTALMYAAQYNNKGALELLLADQGYSVITNIREALVCAVKHCSLDATQIMLDTCRNLLVARCPAIRLIQPKMPKISETSIDFLSHEIIDFIFGLFDAQSIAQMRLVNSNYLFYSHNKFEKIRQERAIALKTALISHIEFAEEKLPWTIMEFDEHEAQVKILALLNAEPEKIRALDLLKI